MGILNLRKSVESVGRSGGKLPILILLAACTLIQSDVHKKIEKWMNTCDESALIDTDPEEQTSLDGFKTDSQKAEELGHWPDEVRSPLSNIKPTFDDGPHPNDLKLIKILEGHDFDPPIFYYTGSKFFTEQTLLELGVDSEGKELENAVTKISPGGFVKWMEKGAGVDHDLLDQNPDEYDRRLAEFLRTKLNPESLEIAKAVYDSGYTIGFHGMFHAPEDSDFHMQNESSEEFEDELEIFERIIQIATGNANYSVRNVRPPFGAGTNDLFSPDFVEFCERQGIEVRNWAISSFDWQENDRRGEQLLATALRLGGRGKKPDILFHSQHQDGTTIGNFGRFLAAWNGHVLSLTTPERRQEVESYKHILENILAGTPENITTNLSSSEYNIGFSFQVAADSAYNVELEPQYMGAIQEGLSQEADGYIEGDTVDLIMRKAPKSTSGMTRLQVARVLKSSETFLGSELETELMEDSEGDFNTFPNMEELMDGRVKFANRGLQVKSIAVDILCQLSKGEFDENFLQSYFPQGRFIDPDSIPTFVRMFKFLKRCNLNDHTVSRIIATAILETGIKNNWDRIGIGKGTVESLGEGLNGVFDDTETIPGLVRKVGFRKQADVMQYGLASVGPGQVPLPISQAMYEAILERNLSREEMERILESPEGAAFGIYLYQRQYETRLSSTIW